MDVSHLLDALNPAQREAVCAPEGHYLVLAGAGSGKTRVLVHRIAWLTEVMRVSPWSVMAVTFTNKAAGEMRGRAETLMPRGGGGLMVGTFHGIAHRLLRQHWREAGLPDTFQILDSDDQQRLVKRVIQSQNLDEARFPPRQGQWFINNAKDEGRRPQAIDPGNNPITRTWIEVYRAYQDQCQRAGLVDFAELLLRAHELMLKNDALLAHYRTRFRHLLVDEFQDTNTVQYAFIRILAGDTAGVFVVGDDDQAIYGWRGAKVENVQHFLRDFPDATTIRLEQNYRSSGNILAAANAVIAHNGARLGKKLWTDQGTGETIDLYAAYNEQDEARFVIERIKAWIDEGGRRSDTAVLYRSNAQSRLFEEQLLVNEIPYRVYGGLRFFERAEIKDALSYLRLVASRHDDAAFERAVNTPPRGIGERTVESVRARARREAVSLWDATLGEIAGGELAGRARNALRGFVETIEALARETRDLTLAEQFAQVIERAQLRAYYETDAKGPSESRLENLEELVNVASRFELGAEDQAAGLTELTAFLSAAALEAGEGEGEAWQDCVQLMTLHSAKGLEFPLVFLVGLEDGLFPSTKSLDEPGRLEEERRLAYVGITRARRKLILSYAESRRLHGTDNYNRPSRFLTELPRELLFEVRPRVQVTRPAGFGRDASGWLAERGLGRGSAIEAPALRLGQRVQHAKFGEGVVTGYEGGGAHARVQVNFEDEGSKWLVLAYAHLTPI
ncbi:MAG TPA: DNA helicase II [Xanthomonadales bacterium]|nr:DNA helicase II [Xanthomonadales bacterium]